MKKIIGFFIFFFMFGCLTSYAYNYAGYYWSSSNPKKGTYYVNTNCADNSCANMEEQLAAIQAGARTWNNEGNANFLFSYQGASDNAYPNDGSAQGGDTNGRNDVLFVQDPNYEYFLENPTIIAVTIWWYYTSTNEIAEADMAFNDVNYDFNAKGHVGYSENDIWGVAAHEFGHFLSLDHSDVSDSTMKNSTSDMKLRDLHSDDIAGIQYIYGETGNSNPALSSPALSSFAGDTQTVFTYSIGYYDKNQNVPTTSLAYIDGIAYPMSLTAGAAYSGTYSVQTTLGAGKHSVYFYFEDGQGGNDIHPVINNPPAENSLPKPLVYEPGLGYEFSGIGWGQETLDYKINPNCEDVASSEEQIYALQAAMRAFNNEANSNVKINYSGTATSTSINYNGKNVIFFDDIGSSHSTDRAESWYSTYTWETLEIDINLNDYYKFSAKGTPTSSQYDIWNTVMYPMGWALGLNPLSGSANKNSIMYYDVVAAGETKKRDLADQDIAGIQALYGKTQNSNPVLSNGRFSYVPSIKIKPYQPLKMDFLKFSVDYFDENQDAPTLAQVFIDDAPYNMLLESGDAYNGEYVFETKLSGGTHSFWFYFEDTQGGSDLQPVVENPPAEDPYTAYVPKVVIRPMNPPASPMDKEGSP